MALRSELVCRSPPVSRNPPADAGRSPVEECGPLQENLIVVHGSGVISQLKEAEFRLDRVCRQFEQAWRQNRPLTIEHCLTLVEPVERPHLLEELIASEWELRVRRGDEPETAEYVGRFSQDEELVVAICSVLAEEHAHSARGTASTPQPGEHLGDYKIIREVGRGGMGIVYEARQESLGRQVALKVLPARRFRSERELQRFRREAQAVARLHHSHIVEIYGVGEQDGVHYFAMRYVTGRGLDQVITELRERLGLSEDDCETSVLTEHRHAGQRSQSAIHSGSSLLLSRALSTPPDSIDSMTAASRYRAVARIGFQVAEALQYAHERGIQHRDVKPSNLLIDRHEVVWLSDFGLAKLDLDAVDLTASDDLVGTLKYMPPEALTGKIDHRSDIYSLGLTLYELVTLRPALDGSDRAQLLEQVKEPQIPAPRWLVPEVPRDLETIILKAMARDLDHRYQSASELAADLERFLNHEPIRARPQSLFTKFRRWVERKPLMAFLALGTLSITSTSVFSFGALYVNALATARQARQDRDLANQMLRIAEHAKTSSELSRKAAEVSTREAQNRLIQAQRAEATAYLQQGDDFAALVWTAETLRSEQRLATSLGDNSAPDVGGTGAGRDKARTDAEGYLALEPALRLRVGAIMQGAPRVVFREWLPKLVVGTGIVDSHSADELADFRVDRDGIWFGAEAAAGAISGGRLCVSNPERTRLLRWNLETGHHEQLLAADLAGSDSSEESVVLTHAVFTNLGRRRVGYDPQQGLHTAELSLAGHAPWSPLEAPPTLRHVQLQAAWESPDGQWLLVSFLTPEDEIVAGLWDLSTGNIARRDFLPVSVRQLQAEFSTDSQRLLVRSDQHVQILTVPSCEPLLPDERFETAASGWSRDGRWFAGQVAGQTCVYQVTAAQKTAPQILDVPVPRQILFQDNSGWLAMLLPRGRVAFYEQAAHQTFHFQDSVHPHEIDAQGFGYSPDGQWYALAHEDGNVRIWNVHNHQPWTGNLRHPGAVRSLCWSPGGDLLATSTQNGLLTVWDISPRARGQFFFHPTADKLKSVRFSPDGQRVAAVGDRGLPVIWNVETGERIEAPRPAGFAHHDRGLSAGGAGQLGLATGAVSDHAAANVLEGVADRQRLEWSDDGAWLVSVSTQQRAAREVAGPRLTVNAWDSQSGLRLPFTADSHPLHPATEVDGLRPLLTADSRLLVPEVGRASLLRLAGAEPIRLPISKHSYPVQVQLSPAAEYAAILDSEGVISLYHPMTADQTRAKMDVRRLQLPPGQAVAAMMFDASGTRLAVVGQFGLRVWATRTGELLTPAVNADLVALRQVCFSPDGRHLATISENHACRIRDTATWNWRGSGFQLESRPVLAQFNPRDNTFVTATEAGLVQIWDWSRGEPLTPPLRKPSALTDAHLSADGRRIAVVGGDCLRVWDLPEPSSLAPEKIAGWAREVSLTAVNTADGTLAPLLPNQFFDHSVETAQPPVNRADQSRVSRCRWHLHQAHLAHVLQDKFAEEFHIRRLCELQPDHPELPLLRSWPRP